jgi:hypothetical protein
MTARLHWPRTLQPHWQVPRHPKLRSYDERKHLDIVAVVHWERGMTVMFM